MFSKIWTKQSTKESFNKIEQLKVTKSCEQNIILLRKLDKVLDLATEVNKTGQQILNLKKLIELNQGRTALTKAFTNTRYGVTMWNAAQSEANIEGRQGYTEIKQALIEEYKNANYGQMPTGDELKKIDKFKSEGKI